MKKTILATALLAATLPAMADKPINLSAGMYGSNTTYTNGGDGDFMKGAVLTAQYAFNDHFALKAAVFSGEETEYKIVENKGYDVSGIIGTGLATEGWKFFGGAGFYGDHWKKGGIEFTSRGVQINAGLGYNWEHFSLDAVIGMRDADGYTANLSKYGLEVDGVVYTAVSVGVRF